jgi:hypothetical protein
MTTSKRRGRNMPAADIHEMFARFAELDPKPTTELEYRTPFELLVAVILSAQATDVGVNKATRRLYPVANTPQQILALGEDGLKRYISSIGLYNAKAANVIAMCRQLLEHHGGEVPRTRAELAPWPPLTARNAFVIAIVIFAGSKATTAPLRRISLNCAKRGSALVATGLPASPTIRSRGGVAAVEEETEEGAIRMNSAPE